MGRLTAWLFANWDRPSIAAFAIALILLILMLAVAAFGPAGIRIPALCAAGGLLVIGQIAFMWGSRGMVTPLKKAQQAFLDGDFEAARAILEDMRNRERADFHALTLLGNIYRQIGLLDDSEAALRQALEAQPSHHFPLYGLGRTLLAQGRYEEAADAIESALKSGAPPIAKADLGEIRFRQGLADEARALLQAARPFAQEPYRALMIACLLYRLDAEPRPAWELIEGGLAYWQASAERYGQTPYGAALAEDVRYMQSLQAES